MKHERCGHISQLIICTDFLPVLLCLTDVFPFLTFDTLSLKPDGLLAEPRQQLQLLYKQMKPEMPAPLLIRSEYFVDPQGK